MNRPITRILVDASPADGTAALASSFDRLSLAAKNAGDLLQQAGFAGSSGDTADELHTALAIHSHLLHQFQIKIRTAERTDIRIMSAETSYAAYKKAMVGQGDEACGVFVTPAHDVEDPERAALEAAHRALKVSGPLDLALQNPALTRALQSYVRGRQRRARATDFKSLAANDRD